MTWNSHKNQGSKKEPQWGGVGGSEEGAVETEIAGKGTMKGEMGKGAL